MKLYILIETGDQSDLSGAAQFFSRVAGAEWSREEAEAKKEELEIMEAAERESSVSDPFYYSIVECEIGATPERNANTGQG